MLTTETGFEIVPEVMGTTLDPQKTLAAVTEALDAGASSVSLEEKEFLRRTVGTSKNEEDILRARSILIERGMEETRALAASYLQKATEELASLPDSTYKELLKSWCDFMLNREL